MSAERVITQEESSLADLMKQIGSVPLYRIPAYPAPGTATEEDLLRLSDSRDRLYELVNGVLVEKPMGYYESLLAATLIYLIRRFLEDDDLGIVLGSDAPIRFLPRSVRLPDLSFLSWDHFPNRKLPLGQILKVAPDLAIEVLSPGNTRAEMALKLQQYFSAGVRLVWYIHPKKQTIQVYTEVGDSRTLTIEDTLDGGSVLPGFRLPVRELFSKAGEREKPSEIGSNVEQD